MKWRGPSSEPRGGLQSTPLFTWHLVVGLQRVVCLAGEASLVDSRRGGGPCEPHWGTGGSCLERQDSWDGVAKSSGLQLSPHVLPVGVMEGSWEAGHAHAQVAVGVGGLGDDAHLVVLVEDVVAPVSGENREALGPEQLLFEVHRPWLFEAEALKSTGFQSDPIRDGSESRNQTWAARCHQRMSLVPPSPSKSKATHVSG